MQEHEYKVYNIEELLALEDNGDHWLVPGLIPKVGRTMVWGPGNTHKTTLLMDLAVAVATQGAFLRQYPVRVHGPVLIVSTESSLVTNAKRLKTFLRAREGQSPEMAARGGRLVNPTSAEVPLFYCQDSFNLDVQAEFTMFEKMIDEIRPVFVLLDPFISFLRGNESSSSETNVFRKNCNQLIKKYKFSMCVIHHASKGNDKNPSTMRGSSAMRDWADTVLEFRERELAKSGVTLKYVEIITDKQRDGARADPLYFIPEHNNLRGTTTFTIMNMDFPIEFLSRGQTQQSVLHQLQTAGRPLFQKELVQLTGCSAARVSTALKEMEADGIVSKDAFLVVPSSPDGSRSRRAPAWRSTGKLTQVDMVESLIKRTQQIDDQVDDMYHLAVLGPVGASE